MYRWLTLFCLTLSPLPALAVSEAVKLNYPAGRPVKESSQWSTTIQTGSGLLQIYKRAQAELEIKGNKGGTALDHPPFNLNFVLRGVQGRGGWNSVCSL